MRSSYRSATAGFRRGLRCGILTFPANRNRLASPWALVVPDGAVAPPMAAVVAAVKRDAKSAKASSYKAASRELSAWRVASTRS